MKLGFIMPNAQELHTIKMFEVAIGAMRDDQQCYLEHLVKSWCITRTYDPLNMMRRAIKKTLNDRP